MIQVIDLFGTNAATFKAIDFPLTTYKNRKKMMNTADCSLRVLNHNYLLACRSSRADFELRSAPTVGPANIEENPFSGSVFLDEFHMLHLALSLCRPV